MTQGGYQVISGYLQKNHEIAPNFTYSHNRNFKSIIGKR